jgi:serine/threonine protein phosphatase PrpC
LIVDDDIIIANAGDCRVVAWRGGEVQRITKDHKPNDEDERRRIEDLGGEITSTELPNGNFYFLDIPTTSIGSISYRVNGILAVARAMGDFALEPYITSVPDIFHLDITDDEFVVIACDGIWDVLQDEEVVQICNAYWKDGKDPYDLEGAACRYVMSL